MSNKHKDYLTSLLNWAEEVEEKVSKMSTDKLEIMEWLDQLGDWKKLVNEKLQSDEEITDKSVEEIQQKSHLLINLLTELLEKSKTRQESNSVPLGKHQLPSLPYAYDALEPYISSDIMRLHHDKHHQSYVDGLNKAELELYRNSKDERLVKHWMREQAFNGSGHYLHTIFWYNMSPDGGGSPSESLLTQIKKDFGSFNKFKTLFTNAANSVEGVGWAILVWQPRSGRLGIQTVEKHQQFSLWDTIPLLVLDVWEHAYYLQYKNNRLEYIQNWWNVVNWQDVQKRFNRANQVVWALY